MMTIVSEATPQTTSNHTHRKKEFYHNLDHGTVKALQLFVIMVP